jgi:1-acyl-sn-glycerol-3-phosphate acyltransferase
VKIETIIKLIRIYSKIFYGYKEYGVENIPPTGPAIFGFNHPGKLLADAFAAIAIMSHREEMPSVVAPEGMFKRGGGFFSQGNTRGGDAIAGRLLNKGVNMISAIGITRSGDSPASQNLVMLDELKAGRAIMLAVEGEVSWHGRLNPSRNGAPWMALRTGAPFIPIAISGSYDIWPRWESSPRFTGKVTARVGEPMYFSEEVPEWIDEKTVEEAGKRIMRTFDSLLV